MVSVRAQVSGELMLIQSGRTGLLEGKPWAGVELTSEARTEEVVLHLIRWSVRHLHNWAFQIFFPVKSRSVEAVTMLAPYLWIRVADLSKLKGVKSIMGVTGLVRDGQDRVIETDDKFVQELIEDARGRAEEWSKGIKRGSFVRVLVGSQRMLCGRVAELDGGRAVVDVSLRLRHLRLTIPVGALENLGRERREYYYNG